MKNSMISILSCTEYGAYFSLTLGYDFIAQTDKEVFVPYRNKINKMLKKYKDQDKDLEYCVDKILNLVNG